PRAGPPGDEQARARRAAPGARPRSRDRGDAGTRTRPAARRPHGAWLPRGTDCVPHRRESDSGGGARPAGGARGAGAERVAAAPAPVAPLHPGGRRGGAADRRAAHLPHPPHACHAPRGARGESAGGRRAGLRRAGHRGGPGLDSSRGGSHADRKSTRLNSSHVSISYAVFCLKKKKTLEHAIDRDTTVLWCPVVTATRPIDHTPTPRNVVFRRRIISTLDDETLVHCGPAARSL